MSGLSRASLWETRVAPLYLVALLESGWALHHFVISLISVFFFDIVSQCSGWLWTLDFSLLSPGIIGMLYHTQYSSLFSNESFLNMLLKKNILLFLVIWKNLLFIAWSIHRFNGAACRGGRKGARGSGDHLKRSFVVHNACPMCLQGFRHHCFWIQR
jgi:hypothetical protein